ncbi:MAG: DinB family protein [Symbiobacteriia bacterium]
MIQVHVGVEVDPEGRALAWAREWFGCTAHGESAEAAAQAMPAALRDFWDWLRRHGETGVPSAGQAIEIAGIEAFEVGSNLADADSEGFFSFDREALSDTEIARARRYRSYARADALELLTRLEAEQLTLPVGRSGRSIAATLAHLATADLWYAQRTGNRPQDKEWLEVLLQELRRVADTQLEARLAADTAGEPVNFRPGVWDEGGRTEQWTPQKSLRRFIWHDLLHVRAIERTLNGQRAIH